MAAGTRSEKQILEACQEELGYRFRNPELLRAALTHASVANTRLASNERLEFLGDAVLGLIVCEQLYERFPEYLEGDLTQIKSEVVSRRVCARASRTLRLERFVFLGKGMSQQAHVSTNVLADVFESLIAAIYLDGGLEAARRFVVQQIGPVIEKLAAGSEGANYKSALQQMAQKEFGVTPQYQLLDEKGPEHSKCFKVAAQIGSQVFAPAWGRNKKEAEQKAACNALHQLRGEPIPFPSD
ncbi:MAG: ribonuclease III [Gemmataceae bacterium]